MDGWEGSVAEEGFSLNIKGMYICIIFKIVLRLY